jgi:hypothetical protein
VNQLSYYVAWWSNGISFGEVSEVFTDRVKAGKWLIQKRLAEDVVEGQVEGFESMVDADNYRLHGVLPK